MKKGGQNSSSSSRARALLSKENNKDGEAGEASFRVYYGATGAAVPFMWESQPGTPKHPMFDKSNDNTVPPLTPPPSYNSSSSSSFRKARRSSSWILSAFRSRSMTSSHVTPTSSLSSSSSSSGHIRSWSTSSSSSSSASLASPVGRKKQVHHKRSASSLCFSGQKSPLLEVDDMAVGSTSPPSTMCFGFVKKQGSSYPMEDADKSILSI